LLLDQFASHRMHGNPTRDFVEGSQQSGDFILWAPAQNMKTPGTIFAAAPGEKNAPHGRLPI
jgi:hypothetical protein